MKKAMLSVTGPQQDDEAVLDNLTLTRLVGHIETRLTTLVRWAAGVAALIVGGVGVFGYVTWDQDQHRLRDQCVSANKSRGEIKAAFEGLYDAFVSFSPGNQQAIDFKTTQMGKLEAALPQRSC